MSALPTTLSIDITELRAILDVVAKGLRRTRNRAYDDLRIAATELLLRTHDKDGTITLTPALLSRLIDFAATHGDKPNG